MSSPEHALLFIFIFLFPRAAPWALAIFFRQRVPRFSRGESVSLFDERCKATSSERNVLIVIRTRGTGNMLRNLFHRRCDNGTIGRWSSSPTPCAKLSLLRRRTENENLRPSSTCTSCSSINLLFKLSTIHLHEKMIMVSTKKKFEFIGKLLFTK